MGQGDIHMPSVTSSVGIKVNLTHALAASKTTVAWTLQDATKKPQAFWRDLEADGRGRLTPVQTAEALRKVRGRSLRERNATTQKAVAQATAAHMLAEGWSADVFAMVLALPHSAQAVVLRQDADGNPLYGSDVVARLFNPASMGELRSRLGW